MSNLDEIIRSHSRGLGLPTGELDLELRLRSFAGDLLRDLAEEMERRGTGRDAVTPDDVRATIALLEGRPAPESASEESDCTVCGHPAYDDALVTQWFDPEADRYVAAHADCAEVEGYRHSA
jgi:hypothetical protein